MSKSLSVSLLELEEAHRRKKNLQGVIYEIAEMADRKKIYSYSFFLLS